MVNKRRLGKFELPNKLNRIDESATDTYCAYIAEPFETGYGYTIGNSLRRILLSSIEGAAISSIKIEGIQHEFQSIDGIVEDVTDIVLNLKKIKLKSHSRDAVKLYIDVNREGVIKAGDIQENNQVEVINPDQVICTLDKPKRFFAELEIKVGRGYCPADENKKDDQPIGVIAIDSLFSPVTLVKYTVENARVGQMTDFDKLIFEISTDGRITPDDALTEAIAIMRHHLDIFDQLGGQSAFEFEEENQEVSEEQNRLRKLLGMSVNEIELSVRAANCLNNANITTVGELTGKSEQEMLKYRNFGKKSLNEIKQKLEQLGLSLGMKLDDRALDKASESVVE